MPDRGLGRDHGGEVGGRRLGIGHLVAAHAHDVVHVVVDHDQQDGIAFQAVALFASQYHICLSVRAAGESVLEVAPKRKITAISNTGNLLSRFIYSSLNFSTTNLCMSAQKRNFAS